MQEFFNNGFILHFISMVESATIGLFIMLCICSVIFGVPKIRDLLFPYEKELLELLKKQSTASSSRAALACGLAILGRMILAGLVLHAVVSPW